MLTELTNLLPIERQTALSREYLLRLGTFAFAFLAVLIIAHGALLFPAYAYVLQEQQIEKGRVAELSEQREESGFTDLSARVASFTERAKSLEGLTTLPSASDSIRAVLELPRTGIRISSFVWAAPEGGDGGHMRVSGVAMTREALRAFDSALGTLPFVHSTDLPLSAYARESDIPFDIALTLSFDTP